jgi:copper transport protein
MGRVRRTLAGASLGAGALLAVTAAIGAGSAAAHAGLVAEEPGAGSQIGAAPDRVRLDFSEPPEGSVSTIEVVDEEGESVTAGQAEVVPRAPLALAVALERLPRGAYTVNFRAISAVDGHATSGSYSFGVRTPAGAARAPAAAADELSWLELAGRWLFLIGTVVLIGSGAAALGRFGGAGGGGIRLVAVGWIAAAAGAALLAEAQRRTAGISFGELLATPLGSTLLWRAVALLVAGIAVALAVVRQGAARQALTVAAAAAFAGGVAHVAGGHAAAGDWAPALPIAVQAAHLLMAGVWIGGLAALLAGTQGDPAERRAAVGRFAAWAAGAAALVVLTGVVRAVDELASFSQLVETGYGRAIVAKLLLAGLIVLVGLRTRRALASEPGGESSRSPGAELVLAAVAIAVAALLGATAPPSPTAAQERPGIVVSGRDPGSHIEAELTAASDEPGPNRFTVRLRDTATDAPVTLEEPALRFGSLEDPEAPGTRLRLEPRQNGSFVGEGKNLDVPGHWGITVTGRAAGRDVEIPLEVDIAGPDVRVSETRIAGEAPFFVKEVPGIGYIRVSPRPERAGPAKLRITCLTPFENKARIATLALSLRAGDGALSPERVRRHGIGSFVANTVFEPGPLEVVVVARDRGGTRMRSAFDLQIPEPGVGRPPG